MDFMLSEETSSPALWLGKLNTVFPEIVFLGYGVACFSLFFFFSFIFFFFFVFSPLENKRKGVSKILKMAPFCLSMESSSLQRN